MERISYSPETLFHVLTHFETADEALRDSLRRAGFTDEAIDGQLRMPGSKFLRTFALSPHGCNGISPNLSPPCTPEPTAGCACRSATTHPSERADWRQTRS